MNVSIEIVDRSKGTGWNRTRRVFIVGPTKGGAQKRQRGERQVLVFPKEWTDIARTKIFLFLFLSSSSSSSLSSSTVRHHRARNERWGKECIDREWQMARTDEAVLPTMQNQKRTDWEVGTRRGAEEREERRRNETKQFAATKKEVQDKPVQTRPDQRTLFSSLSLLLVPLLCLG